MNFGWFPLSGMPFFTKILYATILLVNAGVLSLSYDASGWQDS